MDLKVYYQKIQQVEAGLPGAHVVVMSRETPDGGRAGVANEVTRAVAAKLIVEGSARLATPEEAKAFREGIAAAKRAMEQQAAANRVQVRVISDADLRALQGSAKKS